MRSHVVYTKYFYSLLLPPFPKSEPLTLAISSIFTFAGDAAAFLVLYKIDMATAHVMITPRISIITCIDVDECAGSTLIAWSIKGKVDPSTTDINTISTNAIIIVIVSICVVCGDIKLLNPPTIPKTTGGKEANRNYEV